MYKEIGSNFWIYPDRISKDYDEIDPCCFGIDGCDYTWTSTGRSAISLAITNIIDNNENISKVALLPAFSCESVYEPFYRYGFKIIPYGVGEHFEVIDDLSEISNDIGILLIHKYFGFDTIVNEEQIDELRKKGVIVIEDRTQCLYSSFECIAYDYCVASIRKWSGVLDGGFLVSSKDKIKGKPSEQDRLLEKTKLSAELIKYEYMVNNVGDKQIFLDLYKEAEAILDKQNQVYKISDFSYGYQSSIDAGQLVTDRRNNYLYLINSLQDKEIIIFPDLPRNVTPLYCPIKVQRRSQLQSYLREHNIFAPIIWARNVDIGEANCSNHYTNLLSIPIDQRYNSDDMDRIASVINSFE